MKQERIKELLKGTRYSQEGVSLEQIRGIMATNEDAFLSTARVQLLAQALKEVRAIARFEVDTPTPLQETAFRTVIITANNALRESGLDE